MTALVSILLAFASGIGLGFTAGRVFERIEWQHRFDKYRGKR